MEGSEEEKCFFLASERNAGKEQKRTKEKGEAEETVVRERERER